MKLTEHYNLKKPDGTDLINISDLNDNMDAVDTALKSNAVATATKETPAGAQAKVDALAGDGNTKTVKEVTDLLDSLGDDVDEIGNELRAARGKDEGEIPYGNLSDRLDAIDVAVKNHIDDDDNPHGVKAEQVGYDNTVSELEATTVQGAIDEVEADLLSHKEDDVSHMNSNMPHQFKDLKNNKIYRFGFQVSADGEPQLIYEEVL